MDAPVRRCERLALDVFRRGRGRPKKYWGEVIRRDMEQLQLTEDMTLDRKLVFKLTDEHKQLEKAIASVRFVKEKVEGTAKEGYTVFISKTKEEGETGRFPYLRSDGWMEIKLGEFFNNLGEDGEVEMKLMETDDFKWKSGLIVKGIDIRPN
ncbi:F-box protein PP2-B1 [Capsicum baccatum]|uniref:F-box protein PP2-B1 n=1 Tax=Capsicum baccatum TaxID=33114 RepID=A0A2G2X1P9_CAPBA|nr:F-box protein PP2-B1 [Capsicum baccatum]